MYRNYGDVNFFDYGRLVDNNNSDTKIDIIFCNPYCDEENKYEFGHVVVDIKDTWIDKKAVMDYIGMSSNNFDAIYFALGCLDYYGALNFGVDSFFNDYDWRNCNEEIIKNQLIHYSIEKGVIDE